eukprot:3193298-Alexandrium_andersonii.AAC.1
MAPMRSRNSGGRDSQLEVMPEDVHSQWSVESQQELIEGSGWASFGVGELDITESGSPIPSCPQQSRALALDSERPSQPIK